MSSKAALIVVKVGSHGAPPLVLSVSGSMTGMWPVPEEDKRRAIMVRVTVGLLLRVAEFLTDQVG